MKKSRGQKFITLINNEQRRYSHKRASQAPAKEIKGWKLFAN